MYLRRIPDAARRLAFKEQILRFYSFGRKPFHLGFFFLLLGRSPLARYLELPCSSRLSSHPPRDLFLRKLSWSRFPSEFCRQYSLFPNGFQPDWISGVLSWPAFFVEILSCFPFPDALDVDSHC